jgi:hypothetical protein
LFNINLQLLARPSLCFASGGQRNGVKDTSLPGEVDLAVSETGAEARPDGAEI